MKPNDPVRSSNKQCIQGSSSSLTITLLYISAGVFWLFISYRIVAAQAAVDGRFHILASIKDGLFIAVTALLLFIVLKRKDQRIHNEQLKVAESAAFAGKLLDNLPDLVWIKDPAGVYLSCSKSFEKLVNQPRETILGKTDYDLFPKEKADFYRQHDRLAIENGQTTVNEESADYLEGGYSIWIETSKTPLYNDRNELTGVLGIGRDISRRKQALRESEEKQAFLDQVVDCSPLPMWVGSPTGTTLRANQALYKALNLTPKQIVGQYNLLQDENLQTPEITGKIKTLFSRKEQIRFEIAWRASAVEKVDFSGGNDLVLDVSIFPLLGAEGEITHIICQWMDITERKRFEDELSASEARFRTICQKAPVVISSFDANGHFDLWNDQGRKTFGWTLQELQDADDPMVLFYPDADLRAAANKNIFELHDGEFGEWQTHTRDGRILTMLWSNIHLPDGRFFGVGYDITAQRKAEEALKTALERYRLLADNTLDVIWVMDMNLDFRYVNTAIHDATGYCVNEWIGSNLSEHCDIKNFKHMRTIIMKELEKGPKSNGVVFEAEMKKKDGQSFTAEIRGRIIYDDDGHPGTLQGITRDVSQRKQTEQVLKRHNRELEQFNKLATGRELRMIELKKEINTLYRELGREEPYA